MKQSLEDFLADLATKPNTATGYHNGTAGETGPDVLESDLRELEADDRVESVKPIENGSGTLVQLRVVLALVSVCAHSLQGGPIIEVDPGEEHTCKALAEGGGVPGQCNCDPALITRWKLEQSRLKPSRGLTG